MSTTGFRCVKWTPSHWVQEGWPLGKETPAVKGWESAGRSGVWEEVEDGESEPYPPRILPYELWGSAHMRLKSQRASTGMPAHRTRIATRSQPEKKQQPREDHTGSEGKMPPGSPALPLPTTLSQSIKSDLRFLSRLDFMKSEHTSKTWNPPNMPWRNWKERFERTEMKAASGQKRKTFF